MPPSSALYDILGEIYARLGDRSQAIDYYQKSVDLNPYFFWSQYNLGVLYIHSGQYAQASEHLKKALQSKPEIAVTVFSQSKIYQQLFARMDDPNIQLQQGLELGYKDCYKLLVLANKLQHVDASSMAPLDFAHAPLFLF